MVGEQLDDSLRPEMSQITPSYRVTGLYTTVN